MNHSCLGFFTAKSTVAREYAPLSFVHSHAQEGHNMIGMLRLLDVQQSAASSAVASLTAIRDDQENAPIQENQLLKPDFVLLLSYAAFRSYSCGMRQAKNVT